MVNWLYLRLPISMTAPSRNVTTRHEGVLHNFPCNDLSRLQRRRKYDSEEGRAAIHALLDNVIDSRKLPALFLAVCNADEIIYENHAGWILSIPRRDT